MVLDHNTYKDAVIVYKKDIQQPSYIEEKITLLINALYMCTYQNGEHIK